MAIQITPTTPGTVLISDIFLGISEVPIGMLLREMAENMLSINSAVQRLVVETVTTVHTGYMGVAEDDRSQKLILVSLTTAVEDVDAEDAVHRMALALKEERNNS